MSSETEASDAVQLGGADAVFSLDEIPDQVNDHLNRVYPETQDRRICGYFVSQSLREILQYIYADDIIKLTGTRRVTSTSDELPHLGSGAYLDYTDLSHTQKLELEIRYDRAECGRPFDGDGLLELLDNESQLEDVAVTSLVFRFENDQLHEQLQDLLLDVLDCDSLGAFRQPFYAVMTGRAPGTRGAKRKVRDHHDERYFRKADGLGWHVRTLDLDAIWSHLAWSTTEVLGRNNGTKYTMKDVEARATNHIADDSPTFGAINTPLLVNKWRGEFSRGTTDTKQWDWDTSEGWVRVGGDDS